uniref:SHSP domain-containing protein n=1 Tax=Oryza punctata TaxID=4537 RepID=A0A0E0M5M2_ORYPU
MSMVVASNAPVSRSPVTRASFGTRRVSHTQSWRPPPPPFFPASAAVKCRRPTIPVARSVGPPEKHRPVFNIPPTALLYHVPPPEGKLERWEIKDDEDNIQLWLQVPGLTEDDLEITTTDDLLEIKRKGGDPRRLEDIHGVGSFHLRLLLTKEFVSSQVTAELKAGMLEVTIPKNTNLRRTIVRIGQQSQAPAAGRSVPPKDPRPSNSSPKNNLVRNTSLQSRDPPAREPPKNNLAGGISVPPKDPPPAREPPKNNFAGGINVPPKDPPANEPPRNNVAGGLSVPPKDPPRNTNEPPKNPPGIPEANLGRPN